MSGEADLETLIRGMRPVLNGETYVFLSVPAAVADAHRPACLGMFREAEGVTLIVTQAEAARLDATGGEAWAHITLSIHSSLSAVGFMARVASGLAAAGISVNPVSGFYHDHLFVPWARRHDALAVLERLANG